MNSIEILAKEVIHKVVNNQSEFESLDSLVEHCKEIYKKEIDQAYQDGKDFAIINHCATESTSAASSYAEGYKEGYSRALELVKYKIDNELKSRYELQ